MNDKNYTLPPVYNYSEFYGVGTLVFNDTLAEALAEAIRQSNVKHKMLDAIIKDLMGNEDNDWDCDDDISDLKPAYAYQFLRTATCLLLNEGGAHLLSSAIFDNDNGQPYSAMYSVAHSLKTFKTPKRSSVWDGDSTQVDLAIDNLEHAVRTFKIRKAVREREPSAA